MAFKLRITDLGRAALADGANRGTNAIRLTKMAVGDGSGPGGAADDSLTTLRNQRAVAATDGTSTVSGRIAVRGEFTPEEAYGVSEVGLLGRVGSGAEELYAYWTDNGALLASTAPGTRLVIAGSLDIAPAAAEVTVRISAEVMLGDPALAATVTAVSARVQAIEDADFGAQLTAVAAARTALEARVTALEAGGDSVIRSIQRGVIDAASATVTQVDASKSMLNITSVHFAYATRYAHASRFGLAWSNAAFSGSDDYDPSSGLGSGTRRETSKTKGVFAADEQRTISSPSISRENARLVLDSDGQSIQRVGTSVPIAYELIEFV